MFQYFVIDKKSHTFFTVLNGAIMHYRYHGKVMHKILSYAKKGQADITDYSFGYTISFVIHNNKAMRFSDYYDIIHAGESPEPMPL